MAAIMLVGMNVIAFKQPIGPWTVVSRLIRLGLLSALVFALSAVEASRDCHGGAFSAGFSSGFDTHRCNLVVKIGTDFKFSVPLPQ